MKKTFSKEEVKSINSIEVASQYMNGCRGGQKHPATDVARDGAIVGIMIISGFFLGVGLFLGWLLF
jgi:hypothetical protein